MQKNIRIQVIIHEHELIFFFLDGSLQTSPRYIRITFLGFSSDSWKAFATKQTSPRLGDLQLRMDANDGKLKSLSEAVQLWDW